MNSNLKFVLVFASLFIISLMLNYMPLIVIMGIMTILASADFIRDYLKGVI